MLRYRLEVALVAAIVFVAGLGLRWIAIPTWADRHVAVAEEKYDFEVGQPGPWFSAWSLGDGQAYALIALDPTGDQMAAGIREAGYRFARAGYGWAAWAVSLGNDVFVPYALAVVGAAALVGVFVVAVRMRNRLGPRSWLMLLNPALFIGFAADTSEPMGILLLGLAMATGSTLAAVLLGATRPTFLVGLWQHRRSFVLGVLAAVGITLYSLVAFGAEALVPAGGRLSLPFVGYVEHLSGWGVLLASLSLGTIVIGIRRRDWSWVVAGLFVLCFGPGVVRDPVNAWRAAGLLPVLWAFGPGWSLQKQQVRKVSTVTPSENLST
jgi:hypothetical protein